MAADLDAIHRALAAQVADYITDDWNVAPWPFSGEPLDLIEVWPGDDYINYWSTFGPNGKADLMVRLRLQIAAGDAETAFKKITRALSVGTGHGTSLVDAVMSDPTLGGTVANAIALTGEWPVDEATLSTVAWLPVSIVLTKSGAQV